MNGDLNPLTPATPVPAPGSSYPPSPPVEVVELIAMAVRACPAVASLHGGQFGQTTTYLPGRRVAGVTMSPTEIVVGVIGCYPASVGVIAAQIRAAVDLISPGVPVSVNVEDLALPDEVPMDPAGAEPAEVRSESDIVEPAAVSTEPAVSAAGAGPVLPTPIPGAGPGVDHVSARPPLATPLAPLEKERP